MIQARVGLERPEFDYRYLRQFEAAGIIWYNVTSHDYRNRASVLFCDAPTTLRSTHAIQVDYNLSGSYGIALMSMQRSDDTGYKVPEKTLKHTTVDASRFKRNVFVDICDRWSRGIQKGTIARVALENMDGPRLHKELEKRVEGFVKEYEAYVLSHIINRDNEEPDSEEYGKSYNLDMNDISSKVHAATKRDFEKFIDLLCKDEDAVREFRAHEELLTDEFIGGGLLMSTNGFMDAFAENGCPKIEKIAKKFPRTEYSVEVRHGRHMVVM